MNQDTQARFSFHHKNYVVKTKKQQKSSSSQKDPEPIFSGFDNTPNKIRKAYGVVDITPVNLKSKVAIITSFYISEDKINSDIAHWCKQFKIKEAKVTVINNQNAENTNQDWYMDALISSLSIITMNPSAEIYIICQKVNTPIMTIGVLQDALRIGINIIHMSFGNYEIKTRFTYLDKILKSFSDLVVCASAGNYKLLSYPAACESVFSVGATDLRVPSKGLSATENACEWSSWGSTIGTPVPDYQRFALEKKRIPNKTKFVPDFNMNGILFPVYDGTEDAEKKPAGWKLYAGTTVSCGLFVGMLSLVDQCRLNNSISPLKRSDIVRMLQLPDIHEYFLDISITSEPKIYSTFNESVQGTRSGDFTFATCFGVPNIGKWLSHLGHHQHVFEIENADKYNLYIEKLLATNSKVTMQIYGDSQVTDYSKRDWPQNVCTPFKLVSAYRIPYVPVKSALPTKIGIITVKYCSSIQNELDVWAENFGLPQKNLIIVHLPSEVQETVSLEKKNSNNREKDRDIDNKKKNDDEIIFITKIYKNLDVELAMTVQCIYTINPNAEIIIACAPDAKDKSVRDAIDILCKADCRLVKMNVGDGFMESRGKVYDDAFAMYPDVIFVAGCGDTVLSYPGTSRYVLSVGGTWLQFDDGTLEIAEVAQSPQGLGMTILPTLKPLYQHLVGELADFVFKSCPDVSAVGSILSGFPIFESQTEWSVQFGTSLSASVITGMISLVNQVRQNMNLSPLKLQNIYNLFEQKDAEEYFFSIKEGVVQDARSQRWYEVGRGFDVPTGFGVPDIRKWIDFFSAQNYIFPQQIKIAYDIPIVPIIGKKPKIALITTYMNSEIQNDINVWCNNYSYTPVEIVIVDLAVQGGPEGPEGPEDKSKKVGQKIRTRCKKNAADTNFLECEYYEEQTVRSPEKVQMDSILEASMNMQAIISVNQNVDLLIVNAKDAGVANVKLAIERACALGADIVKINVAFKNSENGLAEMESFFEKHNSSTIFVCAVGDHVIQYPSGSSHVLSVGKTMIKLDSESTRIVEMSSSPQAGGEGPAFCAKPNYQKAIKALDHFSHKCSPELCAIGSELCGFPTYNTTYKWTIQYGTSMAASIIAAMLSVVNQVRFNNNRQRILLRDLHRLFSLQDAATYFYDVTLGAIQDKRDGKVYPASVGFDVASGFGVPKISKFIEFLNKVEYSCCVSRKN